MTTSRRAAEIADNFCEGKYDYRGGYKFTENELAKALDEYAEEVMSNSSTVEYNNVLLGELFNKGAAQMRERAAKLAEISLLGPSERSEREALAEAIRALPLTTESQMNQGQKGTTDGDK